jgi:amino acid adenylation domain-containing protein
VYESERTLRSGFLRACERFSERPALWVDGVEVSYAELLRRAAALAATLARRAPGNDPPLTAVLAQRSVTAYAGILAALLRGHGFVPLNPAFPAARTRQMLERAGACALVVDAGCETYLEELLEGIEQRLVVVLPDLGAAEALAERWPRHEFVAGGELEPAEDFSPALVDADGIAYLLFTSGSTGQPKGVAVAHRNAVHFLDAAAARYGIAEQDRVSQLFDLTFDLSVFDMFVAWERGACVCCPSAKERLVPSSFIRNAGLSVWFSVPSTGVLLRRLGKLRRGAYPGLRLVLFCGEALPVELAEAFAAAAPNAVLENLYGPTEVTIACTAYRFDPSCSPADCRGGVVPIGDPLPGMVALVVDDSMREVAVGEAGELLMGGPQVTLGYWRDPERTAAAFATPPGHAEVFYRTGDRACRPAGGPLIYLGRLDNQVKIQGYRVELEEVEAALREAAQVETAVALGWPPNASGGDGIVAFLGAGAVDLEVVRERVRKKLPAYMLPRTIHLIDEFPLTGHGKVDRKALRRMLEEGA